MSYPIEVVSAPKQSWFTPAESNAYYKARYAREGVTVHWWGNNEQADQHDNIVNYFMGQGQQGVKSVNYVVSDNKITQMVDADNVAFASQNGNPTTISIEFQPTLSAEGYRRGGWLIAQLENRYGHIMSLYPHSHWFSTSCPGTIDINRLRAEADASKQGADDMITDEDNQYYRWNDLFIRIRGRSAGRDEFRAAAVGRSWLTAIEILTDGAPEAVAAQHAQEVGQVAVRDNWEQQIHDLQDQLKANNTALSNLQSKANLSDSLQKQVTELQAKNQACIDQQAKDTETGNAVIRWLGKLFGGK